MQDLFQLLQFFGICGLVVPVLQDWRTLALACVSPWRGGGGALQASKTRSPESHNSMKPQVRLTLASRKGISEGKFIVMNSILTNRIGKAEPKTIRD